MTVFPKRILPANTQASTATRPTLLLVDDEERILRSLRMLFAADYRVLMTTSGYEALEILAKEKVHVLISDQRMPLMTGVELLRQARERSPDTMRLLLTGYADMEAIIGSINEGEVFRYLAKPWNAEEIRATVAAAMEIAVGLSITPQVSLTNASNDEVHDVLLVDQEPAVVTALRTLFAETGPTNLRLHWADSLDHAMAKLEVCKFSLVISEIHVNGEDMTPFLATLKRYHPEVVTIVLTSFQDTSLLMNLINQGQIHRFLPKPVRRTLTMRGILSGIEHHRQITHRPELAQRHQVEAPKVEVNHGLIGRIRGLFGHERRLAN